MTFQVQVSLSSKVMDSFVRDRLSVCLLSINFFSYQKHGFKESNLYITTVFDTTGQIDIINLDFLRAFDKVNHTRLINKL